jgi:osmotically-inducible protein OsmY
MAVFCLIFCLKYICSFKKKAPTMKHIVRTAVLTTLLATQLSGCVGLLVAGAMGGGASVAMDRRDVGANADDKQIEFRTSNLLAETFPKAHINAEVFNRNVLLTGEVLSVDMGKQVEAAVRAIPNVRSVSNELAVGEPSSIATRSEDTLITTKVKALFVEDRLIQSSAFIVTTERGNVYLQGRVTQAEAGRATEIARKVGGVRQVVKVLDYLSDEQFKQLAK